MGNRYAHVESVTTSTLTTAYPISSLQHGFSEVLPVIVGYCQTTQSIQRVFLHQPGFLIDFSPLASLQAIYSLSSALSVLSAADYTSKSVSFAKNPFFGMLLHKPMCAINCKCHPNTYGKCISMDLFTQTHYNLHFHGLTVFTAKHINTK